MSRCLPSLRPMSRPGARWNRPAVWFWVGYLIFVSGLIGYAMFCLGHA